MRPAMKHTVRLALSIVVFAVGGLAHAAGPGDGPSQRGPVSFATIVKTPLAIEGLAADAAGNLYTAGRAGVNGAPCPVWRVDREASPPTLVVVGFLPAPSAATQCSPS